MPDPTPRASGYRWPAEWEVHEATWLAWPHKESSWPGKFDRIPPVFVEMVRALIEGERVRILVRSAEEEAVVRAQLSHGGVDTGPVEIWTLPTDDAWIRDHGPTFVVRPGEPSVAAVDWGYNAWGGKYPPWDRDAVVARSIADRLRMPRFAAGMILEGGSIDGDGEGTILTTESCLLNPNRNPELDRAAIEERLVEFLGAEKVLWLGDGIVGDDTDGHVDDITRFVAPGEVVTAVEESESDENHAALQANLERLAGMTDARGRSLRVHRLPMPGAVYEGGDRLPASYANFYIGNAAVLVPTFADPADGPALEILQGLFPGRRVVGIHARDLVWGLGAFHCLTQQQPAGPGAVFRPV
jgi:agmatine deiminase